MRKFMLAVLAGMMVVGFASQAMAEITVGGSIETRYAIWSNLTLNNGLAGDKNNLSGTQTFFDSNLKLHVDAKITEGLNAFIELEQDNTPWGNASNPRRFFNHYVNENDFFYADEGPFTSSDRKGSKNNGIGVRQAWMNFMVPGLPVGMKIGHQPLALGHGIWLDLHRYGADAILLYSKPMPELLVAVAYAKGLEASPVTPLNRNAKLSSHPAGPYWYSQPTTGQTTATFTTISGITTVTRTESPVAHPENENIAGAGSDFDFWAALANYTWMENNTAGINVSYAHDNSNWIGKFFDGAFAGPNLNFAKRNNIRAMNVGLVADGSIAGLNYKAEADYLYVSVDEFGNALVPGNGDYEVSAWAAMAAADYNLMNMVTLGVEGAYGSGNRTGDPAIIYGILSGPSYGTVFDDAKRTGRKDHAYATPYQLSSYNYAYLYNDKIGQGPYGVGGGMGFGDGYGGFGLANTTYVKVSADFAPMDRMKMGMDVLWLRASNAIIPGQSRSLGWEFDANVSYQIYDNLKLDIMGGYFLTGPFYAYTGYGDLVNSLGNNVDDPFVTTEDGEFGSNLRTDDAFGAEARLTVDF